MRRFKTELAEAAEAAAVVAELAKEGRHGYRATDGQTAAPRVPRMRFRVAAGDDPYALVEEGLRSAAAQLRTGRPLRLAGERRARGGRLGSRPPRRPRCTAR